MDDLDSDLPIRSKLRMIEDMVQIIQHLHKGERKEGALLLDDLKLRSIFLDEKIQQAVLMFAEQICFQYSYDPSHRITKEIQKAADRLIEDLGFSHIIGKP